jgi:hypothetical protein
MRDQAVFAAAVLTHSVSLPVGAVDQFVIAVAEAVQFLDVLEPREAALDLREALHI